MKEEAWKRLEIFVDLRDVDDIGAHLFSRGALGVEIQDHTTFGADAIPDGKARIISFFDSDRDEVSVPFDIDHVGWGDYDDVSWRESWKAFFKPTPLSDRLIVGPPWEQFDAPENGHRIVIEPGMAFGTGTHETTALCADLMDTLFGDDPPAELFDIGCGSGILSIGAKKLGVEAVTGVDIEEEAVRVSNENAVINDIDATFSSDWPQARFEFVIANILGHILLAIRDEIFSHLAEHGTLIVSGVTVDQADRFIAEFLPDDRSVRSREQRGEWVAWVIQ